MAWIDRMDKSDHRLRLRGPVLDRPSFGRTRHGFAAFLEYWR